MNNNQNDTLWCLPSRESFCHLPSCFQLQPNKNNDLAQLADGKFKMACHLCHLRKYLYKSYTYIQFSDGETTTSPYGRGAPFRLGPISPGNYFRVAICFDLGTTRRRFVGGGFVREGFLFPPNFFPSCSINPSQQKANLSPDPQGNLLPSCSTDKSWIPNKKMSDRRTSLCLDLGTTTGWAVLNKRKIITSGSQSFKGSRFQGGGIRFLKFINFLDDLLTTTHVQIRLVFFEEVRRHLGVDAAHAYGGFVAQLTAWCEQHEIAYEGVPVGTIKRHATGRGNATKAQVIESIRARGHQPVDGNEADALALAYWAIDNRLRG